MQLAPAPAINPEGKEAMASEEERQEHRVGPSDRRDSRTGDWRDPKFLVALAAFIVALLGGFWSIARSTAATQAAIEKVTSIDSKLEGIDTKLTAMMLKDNSQEKDLEYVKRDLAEFKQNYAREKELQDTWIKTTREELIELGAKVK